MRLKVFKGYIKIYWGKKFEIWFRKIVYLMFEFVNFCLELKVFKVVMGDYVFFLCFVCILEFLS